MTAGKTCRHCSVPKSAAEFPAMPKMRDGLSSWCRNCHREAARNASRRRSVAMAAQRTPRREARARDRAAQRAAALIGRACQLTWKECPTCNDSFVARRADSTYCGRRCQPNARRRRPTKPRLVQTCPQCEASFLATDGASQTRFCTPRCARVWHRRADRDRRRARRSGPKLADRIDRIRVFERDNWTCGLCGRGVDRALSSTAPLGPTLDHIVPLSCGGSHTYENVQLAHWACNRRKGANHVAA